MSPEHGLGSGHRLGGRQVIGERRIKEGLGGVFADFAGVLLVDGLAGVASGFQRNSDARLGERWLGQHRQRQKNGKKRANETHRGNITKRGHGFFDLFRGFGWIGLALWGEGADRRRANFSTVGEPIGPALYANSFDFRKGQTARRNIWPARRKKRHMEELQKTSSAEDSGDFELGVMLGSRRAFSSVAGRCSAADAECIRRIRDERLYLRRAANWEEFCPEYLGLSKTHANRLIRYLEEFGPDYFELAQLTRVTPEQFRAIAPAVREKNIHVNGEAIALIPEIPTASPRRWRNCGKRSPPRRQRPSTKYWSPSGAARPVSSPSSRSSRARPCRWRRRVRRMARSPRWCSI